MVWEAFSSFTESLIHALGLWDHPGDPHLLDDAAVALPWLQCLGWTIQVPESPAEPGGPSSSGVDPHFSLVKCGVTSPCGEMGAGS